jgi:serpin B
MRPWLIGLGIAVALSAGGGVVLADEKPQKENVAAVVRGDNEFAFDLYARLRENQGNLFFSPSSISTALAMTYAGARGETAAEMARALHFTLPPEALHAGFEALLKEQNTDKAGYKLRVANALWGQQGYGFAPDFLKLTQTHYGAGLYEVNFAAAEQARQKINTWVEKQTQDKIKDLIKPGMVDSSTRLVLTNAIYFKGDWDSPFKKERTRTEPFKLSESNTVQAPLMTQSHDYRYLDGDTFQMLEMPYGSKEMSMVVLLPKKVDGLAELEKTLTADNLGAWLGRLRHREVVVNLPRFKTTSEFSLKAQLSALGMPQLFQAGKADLSGMNDGKEKLFLSAVVHKAFVDVNEEGTEAAAATGGIAKALAVRVKPVFRADHPFVFLIRDTRNGSVLFLGRILNPTK